MLSALEIELDEGFGLMLRLTSDYCGGTLRQTITEQLADPEQS